MRILLLTLLIALPLTSFAHGGRLNTEGCHNNSKTGQYECHRSSEGKPAKTKARAKTRTSARDYNCSDFYDWEDAQDTFERAGGPIVDPFDLDRDSDGIACESLI